MEEIKELLAKLERKKLERVKEINRKFSELKDIIEKVAMHIDIRFTYGTVRYVVATNYKHILMYHDSSRELPLKEDVYWEVRFLSDACELFNEIEQLLANELKKAIESL